MPRGIYKKSKEHIAKLRTYGFQKGHEGFVSPESYKVIGEKTRKRMMKYKGKMPPWLKNKTPFVKGHKINQGEHHWAFKGDKVGMVALHDWVKQRLGRPSECEHCRTTTAKKFEWANKSKKYKRELSDWIRLCTKCHHIYDNQKQKMWATRRLKSNSIY